MTADTDRHAIPAVAALINDIDICLLTTHGDGGALDTRPMSNNGLVEWDGQCWFFAPRHGALVRQVQADPQAIAGYRAAEGFTFVSVSGTVAVDTDTRLKERFWMSELERWFPGGPSDPDVVLLRLDAERARWWSADGDGDADLREDGGAS